MNRSTAIWDPVRDKDVKLKVKETKNAHRRLIDVSRWHSTNWTRFRARIIVRFYKKMDISVLCRAFRLTTRNKLIKDCCQRDFGLFIVDEIDTTQMGTWCKIVYLMVCAMKKEKKRKKSSSPRYRTSSHKQAVSRAIIRKGYVGVCGSALWTVQESAMI